MFQPFVRGDSNRDGSVDVSGAVSTLDYLFLGGAPLTCEDAADANAGGEGKSWCSPVH